MCAHDIPLRRVVIHKNKAVGQNVHLLRNFRNIPALRLPVRLDQDKVLRPQDTVRMVQPGNGIVMLILGRDVEHHADVFLCFDIGLELRIHLSHGSLLPDFQIFHAVIPDDSAPERIVQIQHKRFLVFSEHRLDNISQIVGKFRDRLHTHGIFVHMPVKRIRPSVKPVGRRHVIDIVDVESLMLPCILIKPFIQAVQETDAPLPVYRLLVSKNPVKWILKIVLDHRAVVLLRDLVPHHLKMPVLLLHKLPDPFRAVPRRRICCDIAVGCMDIDQIRGKCRKLRIVKHHVLPVLRILRLVKDRLDPVVQQKNLQYTDDIMGRAASQYRNPFL